MFPLDTIKTRMQTATTASGSGAATAARAATATVGGYAQGAAATVRQAAAPVAGTTVVGGAMRDVIASLMKTEGVAGLYRGIAAVGIGAGPAHAVYFATYEHAKDAFGGNKPGHHPLAHAAAGACATVVGKGGFLAFERIPTPTPRGESFFLILFIPPPFSSSPLLHPRRSFFLTLSPGANPLLTRGWLLVEGRHEPTLAYARNHSSKNIAPLALDAEKKLINFIS